MMRHAFSRFVLLFSAASKIFRTFGRVRCISEFGCHTLKCRGSSMFRYSIAIRNDIFCQLLSNRHYIRLWFKFRHFRIIKYGLFKTTSAHALLKVERIEESLEMFNVFSVSIYNGHVYLHYCLHKHALTPSLIQLYYL